MIIIADSGSTKVDWRIVCDNRKVKSVATEGMNPIYMAEEDIYTAVEEKVLPLVDETVNEIFFYGAGVVGDEIKEKLSSCFSRLFPDARLNVDSDMLAAARALCGYKAGIACIIGTGSNSCFYDGENIERNVKAGGFILGDEASGAYFGKRLISDFIKGLLPQAIEKEFVKRYGLDYPKVVQKVYRDPQPSRFLASFAPFFNEFSNHPYFASLIRSGFEEFLMRNVAQYEYRRYPVNFVGSIAYNFRENLEKAVANCNMRLGTVIQSPIDALVEYHTSSPATKSTNSIIDKSIKAIMSEAGIDEYGKAKDLLMQYGSVKKAVENYKADV